MWIRKGKNQLPQSIKEKKKWKRKKMAEKEESHTFVHSMSILFLSCKKQQKIT